MTKTRRILAIGRGVNRTLIKYFAGLCGKKEPRICLIPTASADDPRLINLWHEMGHAYAFDSYALPLFISSFDQKRSFESILAGMDAVYVGGGNTINMLAVWRAHGIDGMLRELYDDGVLMGGGSAGGICWFESGLTDSRPIELTAMQAMGWLNGSFAPHYLGEPGRRQFYHKYILNGELGDGLAADDTVGLLFENEELVKALGSVPDAEAYRVSKADDRIIEVPLAVEYLQQG